MHLDIPRERLADFLLGMPKAELHVHVEGTLEPEMAIAIARRGGVDPTGAEVAAMRVLRTEEDFHDLASAYLRRAAAEGVVRAEIFFDPQAHTARGVPLATVLRGLSRACREAAGLGVSADLILCFLRHLSEEEAFETLEAALPFRDLFIGVGLDSSERGHPPEKFARVFARCRKLGLHAVAHAGEEGPAREAAERRRLLDRLDGYVTAFAQA